MATCDALTVRGTPCQRAPQAGHDRCAIHLTAQPGWRAMLDEETTERICALLRAGNYDGVAARAAGIAPSTFYEWLQRGRTDRVGDEPYRDFRDRVVKARAEGEAVHVARIAQAAQEDWHASAWFLERSYPDRWGRVSPRPATGREPPAPSEPAPLEEPDGVFAELDELARKRAARPR